MFAKYGGRTVVPWNLLSPNMLYVSPLIAIIYHLCMLLIFEPPFAEY